MASRRLAMCWSWIQTGLCTLGLAAAIAAGSSVVWWSAVGRAETNVTRPTSGPDTCGPADHPPRGVGGSR
jgi:hypothetical protein